MAKFCGKIGYSISSETSPGIWVENITERLYYGEKISNARRWQQPSDSLNSNIIFSNTISIIADPYAYSNYNNMRYIIVDGIRWSIESIKILDRPRVEITTGGEWHGIIPTTSN